MSSVQSLASRLQVVQSDSVPIVVPDSEEEFARGYEEGRAEGLAEALREAELQRAAEEAAFRSHLDSVSESMKTRHAEWLASLEPSLAGLAVAIAAKVIGAEVSSNPEAVGSWIRQALAEVTSDCKASLRVSPRWVEDSKVNVSPSETAAEGEAGDKPPRATGAWGADVLSDVSMPYGCVIETENGMIDARIDSMLSEALAVLREAA